MRVSTWMLLFFFCLIVRLTSAKKDNDFIYHEKVPDPATLMGTKGASLVKPLPFDPSNSAVTGPDIFSKLVPLEAHLTASTYR